MESGYDDTFSQYLRPKWAVAAFQGKGERNKDTKKKLEGQHNTTLLCLSLAHMQVVIYCRVYRSMENGYDDTFSQYLRPKRAVVAFQWKGERNKDQTLFGYTIAVCCYRLTEISLPVSFHHSKYFLSALWVSYLC